MKTIVLIVMALNVLWFLAAFQLFALRSRTAAKLLLRKEIRIEPYFAIVSQLTKFLGGMNLALAVFAVICLVDHDWFLMYRLNYAFFFAFFVAHMSQFWYNVPVAIKEKKNHPSAWSVLKGTMKFIFIGDLLLAICNLILAIYWCYI